ncbi:class I SAM-dependent methyltransferase [Sinomonas sp. P10A9]|uniref:Class I SAM-dependent methyltransferase n=1 Tax=Sinomonas puerhi TaxID=3238584 RepID=A0AB39L339_9MICC
MSSEAAFTGSIPELYDTVLVPMMFQDFANDLAAEVASSGPGTVLETAAGTGIVTRALHRILPRATITATDLNPAMLSRADVVLPASESIRWQQADALDLPFPEASFDALVSQFGIMFFPDRPRGYAEARRVLKPGGRLSAAVWGPLERNEVSLAVQEALEELFPGRAPMLIRRVPFAYSDHTIIRGELEAAGFSDVTIRDVVYRSAPTSARDIARAHCQGTPLAHELAEEYGGPAQITEDVTRVLAERFGGQPFSGLLTAIFFTGIA